uniref:Uncharacterized protein n=1 Tax=Arundo donax TaxID=35708 RepID=A0A0A9C1D9_ARUDO
MCAVRARPDRWLRAGAPG